MQAISLFLILILALSLIGCQHGSNSPISASIEGEISMTSIDLGDRVLILTESTDKEYAPIMNFGCGQLVTKRACEKGLKVQMNDLMNQRPMRDGSRFC
jgi:hypothetical protein